MRKIRNIVLSLLTCVAFTACGGGGGGGDTAAGGGATAAATAPAQPGQPVPPVIPVQPQDPVDVQLRAALTQAGVQALPQAPAADADKVALGEALMFDKLLSGNKDISCASCHHPTLGSADALSVSIGTGGTGLGANRTLGAGRDFVPRNAPALWNLRGVEVMFHDGRVSGNSTVGFQSPAGSALPQGLESALAVQAMFPVTSGVEMLGNPGDMAADGSVNELANLNPNDLQAVWGGIMARLLAIPQYQTMFQAAFPGVAPGNLGFEHAANAIAAYEEETFSVANSPFDRYVAGDDTALTDAQKRGAGLFYGGARCFTCHAGPLQSDLRFHNIAAPQVGPGKAPNEPVDFGREDATGNAADRFQFRTPILRNVALTGPWMHSGSYTSLEAVVRHYRNPANAIQNYNANQLDPQFRNQVHVQEQLNFGILGNISPLIRPVQLDNNDVNDIVAFLNALTTDGAQNIAAPATVPSGLAVD